MNKNITNRNSKGQLHGYQEWYYYDVKLSTKRFYNNNNPIDYGEYYYFSGELHYKCFHI